MKTGEECKVATTSIWSVKGWLGKVVIYVENPEKTTQCRKDQTEREKGRGGDRQ